MTAARKSELTPERIAQIRVWEYVDGATPISEMAAGLRDLLAEIERLRARVAELSERLEITHYYELGTGKSVEADPPLGFGLDGISCRDETIRLQDEQIDLARARDQRREQLLREFIEAFDKGAVEMNSAEIDLGDPDIPPHPWHEEWLHHARAEVGGAK